MKVSGLASENRFLAGWTRIILLIMLSGTCGARAQFDFSRLELRIGYNFFNPGASRFNTLIDRFNNTRYPVEIERNLPNLSFLQGYHTGARYRISEELYVHALFKNQHAWLETRYADNGWYRGYWFRSNAVEIGITSLIQEEKWFRHSGGIGIVAGNLSAFTDWKALPGKRPNREMSNIDHAGMLGISISYEAEFKLFSFARLYLRPHVQYHLNSHLKYLNTFFDPYVTENGPRFRNQPDEKYNHGSFNGIGIDAGLNILLSPHKSDGKQ